jgi:hypothetical protein
MPSVFILSQKRSFLRQLRIRASFLCCRLRLGIKTRLTNNVSYLDIVNAF